MKRIIAVDPGPKQSAILVWDFGKLVGTPKIANNEYVREHLLDSIAIYSTYADMQPTLAIEMIACYGMPVGAEVFETCLFIGRLQEIWLVKNLPLQFVYRKDVKMYLCQSMKAKDPNIRQALIDRYGVVGTKKNPGPLYGITSHLWAALGVAVTAQNLIESNKL